VAEEWAREKLGRDNGKAGALGTSIFGGLLADGVPVGEGFRDHRRACPAELLGRSLPRTQQ
jgi:hypothetical protein